MTSNDYKGDSTEWRYHLSGKEVLREGGLASELISNDGEVGWIVKRSSWARIKKETNHTLLESILWDEVVPSWTKSKRTHYWRSGGTSSTSASAPSCGSTSACFFSRHATVEPSESCEHEQKPTLGPGNKMGPNTFLSTSDRQHRKQSPPGGTNPMTSYHCHHQNPTGRSSGTELLSCCLYYCLQSRSLLLGHQPLCLRGQPERKQKWHWLPCAYFQPCPLPEFTSWGTFICLEKII